MCLCVCVLAATASASTTSILWVCVLFCVSFCDGLKRTTTQRRHQKHGAAGHFTLATDCFVSDWVKAFEQGTCEICNLWGQMGFTLDQSFGTGHEHNLQFRETDW